MIIFINFCIISTLIGLNSSKFVLVKIEENELTKGHKFLVKLVRWSKGEWDDKTKSENVEIKPDEDYKPLEVPKQWDEDLKEKKRGELFIFALKVEIVGNELIEIKPIPFMSNKEPKLKIHFKKKNGVIKGNCTGQLQRKKVLEAYMNKIDEHLSLNKRLSKVWKYFKKERRNSFDVICKLCNEKLKRNADASTRSMWNHLSYKHEEEHKLLKQDEGGKSNNDNILGSNEKYKQDGFEGGLSSNEGNSPKAQMLQHQQNSITNNQHSADYAQGQQSNLIPARHGILESHTNILPQNVQNPAEQKKIQQISEDEWENSRKKEKGKMVVSEIGNNEMRLGKRAQPSAEPKLMQSSIDAIIPRKAEIGEKHPQKKQKLMPANDSPFPLNWQEHQQEHENLGQTENLATATGRQFSKMGGTFADEYEGRPELASSEFTDQDQQDPTNIPTKNTGENIEEMRQNSPIHLIHTESMAERMREFFPIGSSHSQQRNIRGHENLQSIQALSFNAIGQQNHGNVSDTVATPSTKPDYTVIGDDDDGNEIANMFTLDDQENPSL